MRVLLPCFRPGASTGSRSLEKFRPMAVSVLHPCLRLGASSRSRPQKKLRLAAVSVLLHPRFRLALSSDSHLRLIPFGGYFGRGKKRLRLLTLSASHPSFHTGQSRLPLNPFGG